MHTLLVKDALAGIFAGLAICTKPNAVAGPVMAAALIWWTQRPRPVAERLRLLFVAAIGAAAPVIATVVDFYAAGALSELIDTHVLFNSIRGRLIFSVNGVLNLFSLLIRYLRDSGVLSLTIVVGLALTLGAVRGKLSRARGRPSGDRGELIIWSRLLLECSLRCRMTRRNSTFTPY